MDQDNLLFKLPTDPDEFGVVLPSSNLRRLDFSGLDYDTARRAIVEYIQTYFPDEFNDFVASNGIIMIMEIIANTTGKLSLRADLLANESFLPTAVTEEAVVNHLALINQKLRRQTPATVDVECAVDLPLFTDLRIPAGTQFNTIGSDDQTVIYEIYRSPGDWFSDIIIPAGKRGVIAWGIEGQFITPFEEVSSGGPNQRYIIIAKDVLEAPIFCNITVGGIVEEWTVVTDPIARYGPNDRVVEVNFFDDRVIFNFGDDITGRSPVAGSNISFRYRVGGGRRGRLGINQINALRQLQPNLPANAAVPVNFRNITPSVGGTDRESAASAKKRAPRDFAVQRSIVTATDYVQSAISFAHPVFGSVSKAVAVVKTAINTNRVEVYILAEGSGDIPVAPSSGLKTGLTTYLSDLNVLTDHVVVLDGLLLPVDIDMNVVIDRNADGSIVKVRVEDAISQFFSINNWDMGEAFYVSNFIEVLEAIDGVKYVDLFAPSDNILQSGQLADSSPVGSIAVNQLIIEGSRVTNYYYEK
jgi:hypothetical protein